MTNDDWNLVGPQVSEVRESEYESFLGSKVKKTWVWKSLIVANSDGNLVGPWVIGVGESEYESFVGSKVKKTSFLETGNSDR